MATPHRTDSVQPSPFRRLLREPTLHFFVVAALVLLGQRLIADDPRTIELSASHKADLLRRYQDQLGRAPTSAEVAAFILAWKAEEALYREALEVGIDRDDPSVRNLLVGKMRERLLLQTRLHEPSAAELEQYLDRHRGEFEAPLIYEHEWVAFPKQQPGAEQERDEYERKLKAGATPAALGLRSTAANVNRERIEREFGPEVAEKIARLPRGAWQKLEAGERLLLVKLSRIHGGLPAPDELRARLLAGWKGEEAQKALTRATEGLVGRYRFEEEDR